MLPPRLDPATLRIVRSRLVPLLALAFVLVGCDINGTGQVYPGASVFQAPDRSFHFHFLSPPWRYKPHATGEIVHLVVDSFSQFNDDPKDLSITHKLWVKAATSADPRSAVQVLRDEARTKTRTITRDLHQVTTLTGEKGWQYLAYRDEKTGRFYYRDSALALGSSAAVLFSFVAAYPLDEHEIDDLVQSFSAGPDPGEDTPPRIWDATARDGAARDVKPSVDGGGR